MRELSIADFRQLTEGEKRLDIRIFPKEILCF